MFPYGRGKRPINAPVEIKNAPLNLLRSHLYPVWPDLTQNALQSVKDGAAPAAVMLQIGAQMPLYRNAVDGIVAMRRAQAETERFRLLGLRSAAQAVAPSERIQQITTVHAGQNVWKTLKQSEIPGGKRDVPFQPRSDIPLSLRERAATLYNQFWKK